MKNNQVKIKQELNRLRRQKSVLWLGILFFVAVLVWTSFSIFSSQKKVKVDSELTELAKPLIPRLSAEVFPRIEAKRYLSEAELKEFPIFVYWADEKNQAGALVNIMETTTDQVNVEENDDLELQPLASASATASPSGDLATGSAELAPN